MKLLLLMLVCCAPAPATPVLSCPDTCSDCEAACEHDPSCENQCYGWNSACCAYNGQRAVAARCACY